MEVDVNQHAFEALGRMKYSDACGVVLALFARTLQQRDEAKREADEAMKRVKGDMLDRRTFDLKNGNALDSKAQAYKQFDAVADALAIVMANSREPLTGTGKDGSLIVVPHPLAGVGNQDSVIIGDDAMDKLRRGEALTIEDTKQIVLVRNVNASTS